MNFPRITSSRRAIALLITAALLTPTQSAHAVTTTVACGTNGFFTITDNVVVSNSSCEGTVVVPSGVTTIGYRAFFVTPLITSVTLPDSVTVIRESAFRTTTNLATLNLGNGLQVIEPWNFADSTSLTSVTIPSSVNSIQVGVFYSSSSLSSVTFLGNAPSTSSNNAFGNMAVGARAYVNFDATGFGADGSIWKNLLVTVAAPPVFNGRTGAVNCGTSGFFYITSFVLTSNSSCIGSVVIPTGVTSIYEFAFFDNSAITSISIPNTVTSIGIYAFYGNSGLTSVTIPGSITAISDNAFDTASSITSLVISNGVSIIGNSAFARLSSLTSLTIPSSVTTIATGAFQDASSLTSLTIPSTVTSIGQIAFTGLTALSTYTYCGTVSQSDLDDAGLNGITRNSCAPAYVPPTPVPFLNAAKAATMHQKDGELLCTAGSYQTGFTYDRIADTGSIAVFKPSAFTFTLFIDGKAHTDSQITTATDHATWANAQLPAVSTVTCSVAITGKSLSYIDNSTNNNAGVETAKRAHTKAVATSHSLYATSVKTNANTYQKMLRDNRAQWLKESSSINANYFVTLDRIKSAGQPSKMISDISTALEIMLNAKKKSAADYLASKPAALSAKNAANQLALLAREAAITKANTTYGTFIESIGYGVLIR